MFCHQVSKAACILTTQNLTRTLRSKEAAASVNIKTWPVIIDTGKIYKIYKICKLCKIYKIYKIYSSRADMLTQVRLCDSEPHSCEPETEATKWNLAVFHFIIYICAYYSVTCQHVSETLIKSRLPSNE